MGHDDYGKSWYNSKTIIAQCIDNVTVTIET